MPTIMCTRNLWRSIGGRDVLPARAVDHVGGVKLRAWSARELLTRSGPLLIGVEEITYLTIVCPLLPLPQFLHSFAASVATQLEILGVPAAVIEIEVAGILDRAHFAKNDNRSLLGSVNDVAFHVDVLLESEHPFDLGTLQKVQAELNEMPHVHREPAFPDQAVRLLFSSAVTYT
jgi:uncharacterized protein DUF6933